MSINVDLPASVELELVEAMREEGLTENEVIAKALGIIRWSDIAEKPTAKISFHYVYMDNV